MEAQFEPVRGTLRQLQAEIELLGGRKLDAGLAARVEEVHGEVLAEMQRLQELKGTVQDMAHRSAERLDQMGVKQTAQHKAVSDVQAAMGGVESKLSGLRDDVDEIKNKPPDLSIPAQIAELRELLGEEKIRSEDANKLVNGRQDATDKLLDELESKIGAVEKDATVLRQSPYTHGPMALQHDPAALQHGPMALQHGPMALYPWPHGPTAWSYDPTAWSYGPTAWPRGPAACGSKATGYPHRPIVRRWPNAYSRHHHRYDHAAGPSCLHSRSASRRSLPRWARCGKARTRRMPSSASRSQP